MKHIKAITPASAIVIRPLGGFSPAAWVGFWISETQNSLAQWKGFVAWNGDNVDPEDIVN